MNVLITGGSEGIGEKLAECFASDHADLILASRNAGKLKAVQHFIEEQYGVHVLIVSVDLSKDGAAEKLHDALHAHHVHVDVLINNAGIGFAGRSVDIPCEKEEQMVRLNDAALMSLCKLYLKDFMEQGKGEIINIASTGAFQPGPYIAGYYASKAFVLSYTRALAEETRSTGIKVYCYCPGPVDTAFYEKSGGRKTIGAVSAEQAARFLYTHRGRNPVIIPGILNKAMLAVPSGLKMKVVEIMKRSSL